MSLENLSSQALRSLLPLTVKREALITELEQVEAKIEKILTQPGRAAAAPRTVVNKKVSELIAKASGAPRKRAKRGSVRELILAGFREAGATGISVKELAQNIGVKPQNIHVWLHTTGKKNGLIRAIGRGIYRLEEQLGLQSVSIEAPKPKVTATLPEAPAAKPAKVRKSPKASKAAPAAKAPKAPKVAPAPKAAKAAKAPKAARKSSKK